MGQKRCPDNYGRTKTFVMKQLIEFLITNITGSSDFSVEEQEVDGRVIIRVSANPDIIGLIIGKEGKTIKNIRKILSIRATQENKAVAIDVVEKE